MLERRYLRCSCRSKGTFVFVPKRRCYSPLFSWRKERYHLPSLSVPKRRYSSSLFSCRNGGIIGLRFLAQTKVLFCYFLLEDGNHLWPSLIAYPRKLGKSLEQHLRISCRHEGALVFMPKQRYHIIFLWLGGGGVLLVGQLDCGSEDSKQGL